MKQILFSVCVLCVGLAHNNVSAQQIQVGYGFGLNLISGEELKSFETTIDGQDRTAFHIYQNQDYIMVAGVVNFSDQDPVSIIEVSYQGDIFGGLLADPNSFAGLDGFLLGTGLPITLFSPAPIFDITPGQTRVIFAATVTGNIPSDNFGSFGTDSMQIVSLDANSMLIADDREVGAEVHFLITESWQNSMSPLDVDSDGVVAPLDALLVVNDLNSNEDGFVPNRSPNPGEPLVDVTANGIVGPLDAMLIINAL